jgi:hypothetical protein
MVDRDDANARRQHSRDLGISAGPRPSLIGVKHIGRECADRPHMCEYRGARARAGSQIDDPNRSLWTVIGDRFPNRRVNGQHSDLDLRGESPQEITERQLGATDLVRVGVSEHSQQPTGTHASMRS